MVFCSNDASFQVYRGFESNGLSLVEECPGLCLVLSDDEIAGWMGRDLVTQEA
jgi:hypothetical protein